MRNKRMTSFWMFLLLCFSVFELEATQLPEGFAEVQIAEGLDPVAMTLAPDGRIFLAEKNGRILIVRDGTVLPDPFMTIEVDNYNERGIQSIVLHPDFDINNFFYIFYMAPGDNFNKVSRFTANGDFAIPGSEEVIYEMDLVFGPNHNGGGMQFGADGKLYITTGDGVDGGVPQNSSKTGGKILRINDDGSIPEDNPFYNENEGKYRAIWCLGLRSPFTLAVQPNTSRFFFCDVGQSLWEEVNEVERGMNYGWPQVEGVYTSGSQPNNYKDPIHAYDHDVGCAVVGATFYNPLVSQFPLNYVGKFFFMDYCKGFIKVMDPDTGEILETFATEIDRPIALLVDQEGAMYYIARAGMGGGSPDDNTSSDNGRLMKIIFTGSGAPFVADHPASILVPENENVNFQIQAFGADPLNYQWQKDGVDIPNETNASFQYNNTSLTDDGSEFTCRVSNAQGSTTSDAAVLSVTDGTRPQPSILNPVDGALYIAGNEIAFSGMAMDTEDGELEASVFEWKVDFHHLDHTHPAMSTLMGVKEGSFEIPQIGEISDEVFYRIYLTVTDSEGLRQSTFQDVFPVKREIELRTQPSGLKLVVDGRVDLSPTIIQSVEGIQRAVVAPFTQERNDSIFIFSHWEDGSEDMLKQYFAGENTEPIIATFEGRPLDGGIGLFAEYFDYVDEAPNFDQEPKRTRIDKQIDFNWVLLSPYEWTVGVDSFCVRWTGSVMPLFDENYTFYVNADDGVRLWIDDELILDQWEVVTDLTEEHSATFQMQKGQFHKFKLEYFENKRNARCILSWSSPSTPKQVIPSGQLFPKLYDINQAFFSVLYPNPSEGNVNLRVITEDAIDATMSVFDVSGRLMYRVPMPLTRRVTEQPFDFSGLAPGMYFFQISSNTINKVMPFKIE